MVLPAPACRGIALMLFLAATVPSPSHARPPAPQSSPAPTEQAPARQVDWQVPEGDIGKAISASRFRGKVQPASANAKSRSPVALVVIVGVLVIPYLADALVQVYKNARYGGALVDATGPTITIRHDPGLRGGVIVVKTKTAGTKIVDTGKVEAPAALIQSLLIKK
jgi:hypothetical protein